MLVVLFLKSKYDTDKLDLEIYIYIYIYIYVEDKILDTSGLVKK